MKRGIYLMVICLMLSVPAMAVDVGAAQADMFAADSLWDGMSDRTLAIMGMYDPLVQTDFSEGVETILSDAVSQSGGVVKTTLSVMLRIFVSLVLCRLAGTFGGEKSAATATLVGALSIMVCCVSDIRSMIGLGQSVMEEISSFSTLLLPVLAAAAAASGAAASGGAIYAVTALFCDILIRICRYLLVPLVYAFLALGLADGALGQNRLAKLQELIGWIVKTLLKAVLYLFTGFLAATGVISGAADAAALKAARLTISGMIPVVGGIVSDASESLLASAGVLKGAIGTFGMLAVLSIFVLPFMQLGISYLGFKFTAAVGGLLQSGQDRFLDSITGAMGYLLAMVGSCTVMALIACCCMIRVAV